MPNHRQGLATSPLFSELTLRVLIDALSDHAVLLLDADGAIASWSPGAERITGFAGEDVIGRSFELLFTDEDLASQLPVRRWPRPLSTVASNMKAGGGARTVNLTGRTPFSPPSGTMMAA